MLSPVLPKTLDKEQTWSLKREKLLLLCALPLPVRDLEVMLWWVSAGLIHHTKPSRLLCMFLIARKNESIRRSNRHFQTDVKRRELIFNWCKGGLNSCEYTQVRLYLLLCCVAISWHKFKPEDSNWRCSKQFCMIESPISHWLLWKMKFKSCGWACSEDLNFHYITNFLNHMEIVALWWQVPEFSWTVMGMIKENLAISDKENFNVMFNNIISIMEYINIIFNNLKILF